MDQGQMNLYWFLFVGMVVMFVLAGGVAAFFLVYQRKLFAQQLRVSAMETKYQEDLVNSNLESVEEERQRIAKDLHDEVGSLFSTLRLKLGQLTGVVPDDSKQIIAEAGALIDSGVQSIRRISHDITPPGLEMFGLVDSLENLLEKISSSGEIETYLHVETPVSRFPLKQELGLYRIVQELLNNTLKHAEATAINVRLSENETHLSLEYIDNGKGFAPAVWQTGRGLGLKNIEARTNLIQGTLAWETSPGAGLKTVITIPSHFKT